MRHCTEIERITEGQNTTCGSKKVILQIEHNESALVVTVSG